MNGVTASYRLFLVLGVAALALACGNGGETTPRRTDAPEFHSPENAAEVRAMLESVLPEPLRAAAARPLEMQSPDGDPIMLEECLSGRSVSAVSWQYEVPDPAASELIVSLDISVRKGTMSMEIEPTWFFTQEETGWTTVDPPVCELPFVD